MPRKAKEKIEELNNIENKEKVKKVGTKKTSATSSTTVKSKTTSNSTKSKTVTKKTFNDNKSKKKSTTIKSKTKSKVAAQVSPIISTEYYDLPFRYNQTIIRILAQTPNTLFIYWDISDEDRKSYVQKYGENFFDNTRPYLIITNVTMNYSFEVEINDFANSWYLHINDADCEYKVELCRKFVTNSNIIDNSNEFNSESHQINDYLYITSSNELEMPNNQILFDKLGSSVFFRNTKTNITEEKDISSISFLQKIGKVYNIYDLYKEIYEDELISDEFGLNLPSSNSSNFK